MATAEMTVHEPIPPEQMLERTKTLCDSISRHKVEDTQALFGDLHKMATLYYRGALSQAKHSFWLAQVFAASGTLAVLIVLWVGMKTGDYSKLGLVAGLVTQVVSGLNFYLYRKATKQFELFHVCLERMGRYLMANSISANIEDSKRRDESRRELAMIMAKAPMLPAECVQESKQGHAQDDVPTPPIPATAA